MECLLLLAGLQARVGCYQGDNSELVSVTSAVDVLVRERDGSDFYRLLEPARVLVDQGFDVQVIPTALSARPESTVVLSRPIDDSGLQAVGWLADTGHRVVVDMDDDFDNIPLTHGIHGRVDTSYTHASCKMADVVTTSTPALAQLYGHGHGVVLPNCVPERYLSVLPDWPHDASWVGWYGGSHAHPEDLRITNGGVARALEAAAAAFCFIGDRAESTWVRTCLKLRGDLILGGWYVLDKLPQAISNFTVGIVPLAGLLFNDSKSCLKMMELAACGVPVVASPTPDNRRLNNIGVGVLAEYPNDWFRQVKLLLTDPDHRAYFSARGRAAMATWTYENQAGRWFDVWRPCSS